jgi:hypothetical protein
VDLPGGAARGLKENVARAGVITLRRLEVAAMPNWKPGSFCITEPALWMFLALASNSAVNPPKKNIQTRRVAMSSAAIRKSSSRTPKSGRFSELRARPGRLWRPACCSSGPE